MAVKTKKTKSAARKAPARRAPAGNDLRELIARIERQKGVEGAPGAWTLTSRAAGNLNSLQLAALQSSVHSANSFQPVKGKGKIVSASDDNDALIDWIRKQYRLAAGVVRALRDVLEGTTVSYHWWGAELDLDKTAAVSIEMLLDLPIIPIITVTAMSRTAGIILLVLKGVGLGLKDDLVKFRNDKGVRITLYLYAYPVVSAKP